MNRIESSICVGCGSGAGKQINAKNKKYFHKLPGAGEGNRQKTNFFREVATSWQEKCKKSYFRCQLLAGNEDRPSSIRIRHISRGPRESRSRVESSRVESSGQAKLGHSGTAMASKNETTPLMGGGDGHKRSDSQPSYYFLQRTVSLQRTESAMQGAEGGEVVELPPEGASSAEFDSRPVAVRFPWTFEAVRLVEILCWYGGWALRLERPCT